MFLRFLTIALRAVRRHPGYAILNIGGLAVGLAACLLIALYVHHELRYDTFHEKADRIVRVVKDVQTEGQTVRQAVTSTPLAPALEQEFAAVDESVRLFTGAATLRRGETFLDVERVRFADSTFFDVFSFELLHGDPQAALDEPNEVVLSAEVAKRYFGDANPVGKTLEEASGRTVTVSGVLARLPSYSTFRATCSSQCSRSNGPILSPSRSGS